MVEPGAVDLRGALHLLRSARRQSGAPRSPRSRRWLGWQACTGQRSQKPWTTWSSAGSSRDPRLTAGGSISTARSAAVEDPGCESTGRRPSGVCARPRGASTSRRCVSGPRRACGRRRPRSGLWAARSARQVRRHLAYLVQSGALWRIRLGGAGYRRPTDHYRNLIFSPGIDPPEQLVELRREIRTHGDEDEIRAFDEAMKRALALT